MAIHGSSVVRTLLGAFNPVVRNGIERRYEAMLRELEFLHARNNENLTYLQQKGWFEERLQVLFLLNSMYQHCIGPIQASARVSAGLGGDIPIRHGADLFGAQRGSAVVAMTNDFFSMVTQLGFLRDWMTKNTCGDLIYWVARYERDKDALGEL